MAGTYTFQHMTDGSDETLTAQFNVAAKDIALAQVDVDCGVEVWHLVGHVDGEP